jgi:hypothetical protein
MTLHADDTGRDGEHKLVLTLGVWAAQLSIQEASHLLTKPRLWLADPFNILELGGSTLSLVGICLRLLDIVTDPRSALLYAQVGKYLNLGMRKPALSLSSESGNHLAQALIGLSLALLWTSQWCRLLSRTTSFGPLIFMAQQMVNDVAQFAVVLVGVIFGFASALLVAVRGSGSLLSDECGYLDEEAEGGGLLATAEVLTELMLGRSIDHECLKQSSHPIWAPLIMNGFRAISVVLALNMLIAQMATSYEKCRERLGTSVVFQSSLLMLSWFQQPVVPAPLRILGLPYLLLVALYRLPSATARLCCRGLRVLSSEWWYEPFQSESAPPAGPTIAATAAVLREAAKEYLATCADERIAEDERWRARIAKELVKLKKQGEVTASITDLVAMKKEIVNEIVAKLGPR